MPEFGDNFINETRTSADTLITILDSVSRLVPTNSKIVDILLVRSLVVKQQMLAAAYELYEPRKTKSNAAKLNNAVLAYFGVRLKLDRQSSEHKQFFKDCMEGIAPALSSHKALQEEKGKEAESELNQILNTADVSAGGLRDGTVWKAMVTAEMTLQQVLDLASEPNGLLLGPFKVVQGLKVHLSSAEMSYKAELSKWGITVYNEPLLAEVVRLSALSQACAFETQLARVFKKPLAEQPAGVVKYMGLYAGVPPADVLPQFWERAQQIVKGQ